MRRHLAVLLWAALPLQAAPDTSSVNVYAVSAHRVLKSGDHARIADALAKRAEKMGGWTVREDPGQIVVRVPSDSTAELLRQTDSGGVIVDRSYNRADNTSQFWRLKAQLEAKRSLLDNYLAALDSARSQGIYAVSRAIADLQQGIAETAGRIEGMKKRMAFAEITVDFSFRERGEPLTSGHSDFRWLSTLDVRFLYGDFR